jgi:hypothetical protein
VTHARTVRERVTPLPLPRVVLVVPALLSSCWQLSGAGLGHPGILFMAKRGEHLPRRCVGCIECVQCWGGLPIYFVWAFSSVVGWLGWIEQKKFKTPTISPNISTTTPSLLGGWCARWLGELCISPLGNMAPRGRRTRCRS